MSEAQPNPAAPFAQALVIGASGGIGAAMAGALAAAGAGITGLSRRADGLDVTREETIADAAARVASKAPFDLIFIATGALAPVGRRPEKAFAEIDPAAMAETFAVNAIGPALLIKHFAPFLPRERRGVLAALSARVGSIGDNRLGGWMSYRASKAALNQILRCASVEIARTRPAAVVLALHPGTVETPFTADYARGRDRAPAPVAAAALIEVLARAGRADSGGFRAYDGAEIVW